MHERQGAQAGTEVMSHWPTAATGDAIVPLEWTAQPAN